MNAGLITAALVRESAIIGPQRTALISIIISQLILLVLKTQNVKAVAAAGLVVSVIGTQASARAMTSKPCL